ncbi:MAG: cyclic nucleotide-binding domain-containing protein [Endomicrobiales bacterium]|nr:cyclic nucleotide-binding domain-containing protein [Endomicrobiales bacterium]
MDKLSLLKSVFIFSGLDGKLLETISGHLKEMKCSAGKEIFRQQQKADAFYIVDKGEVTILKKLGASNEKILAVLGPGSVFGEMAFFSDSPRTANAVAKTETVLWEIERDDFLKFISSEPNAGLKILSGLLQVSMDRLEQTSRELATVYQTGKVISSGQRLDAIVKGILDEILLAVPEAENGAIYLYNEFNEEFDPVAAPRGFKEITANNGLVKTLNKNPAGALVDLEKNEISGTEFLSGAKKLLCAPVLKEGRLLGFILLWSGKPDAVFKSNYVLLAASVSGQMAEAVENIRHHQEEIDRQRLNNAKQNY